MSSTPPNSDPGEIAAILCPICGQTHRYSLKVTRNTIYYFNGRYSDWTDRQFNRVFTCPLQNRNFKATIVLKDRREDHIEDLDVGPPINE